MTVYMAMRSIMLFETLSLAFVLGICMLCLFSSVAREANFSQC